MKGLTGLSTPIIKTIGAKGFGLLWKKETHILTLQPGAIGINANARRYSADTNYGTSTNLYARASDGANDSNILLKFDLSGIPIGAIITSVNLYMNGYSTQGATMTVDGIHYSALGAAAIAAAWKTAIGY